MAKQVKTATKDVVPQNENPQNTIERKNLFIKVDMFDLAGKQVGTRIVDLYHPGTRDWLQRNNWWAMHHAHTVETKKATDEEIQEYLDAAKQRLADHFGHATKAA